MNKFYVLTQLETLDQGKRMMMNDIDKAECPLDDSVSETQSWYSEFTKVPEVYQLQVRDSVWDQVQSYLDPNEIDFVRREIGNQLIQENEDLMSEMKALIDILHHFRFENEKSLERIENIKTNLHNAASMRLLKQHIGTLATSLQGRAKERGKMRLDKLFTSERERAVFHFVMEPSVPTRPLSAKSCSRPSTGSSCDSRSSNTSMNSVESLDIEQLKPNLNFFNIDEVVVQLRETLTQEKIALSEDIEYVRELLEEEYRFERETCEFKPPSEREIRELESKLSKEIEKEEAKKLLNKTTEVVKKLKPIGEAVNTKPNSSFSKLRDPRERSASQEPRQLSAPSTQDEVVCVSKTSSVLRLRDTVSQSREVVSTKRVDLFKHAWTESNDKR